MPNFKNKICIVCNVEFTISCGGQKTCSNKCSIKHRQGSLRAWVTKNKDRRNATIKARAAIPEVQIKRRAYHIAWYYKTWRNYFCGSLGKHDRRKYLTVDYLLEILEKQDYKCALSGIPFTRERGSANNPSIDRIEAGKEYTKDNIQLVILCLNKWRADTDLKEFIEICKLIAEKHK